MEKVDKDAFDEIKGFMARDNLFTYPDFNSTFKIHTYANTFDLGEVIRQKSNQSLTTVEN